MIGAAITGCLGIGIAAISAYLHVHGKDGSGWGFVALILVMVSCSHATQ